MVIKGILKEKPVFVLTVLSIFLFVLNISSCVSSCGQNSARRKEMAQRLDMEEKMVKANQEKAALLEKLKTSEKELEEEKAASQSAKKSLAQEQLVSQNLKDELQRLSKLKESLEDNLKEALAANKKGRK